MSLEGLNADQRQAALSKGPTLVLAGAGCIVGDTKIRFNRCGKGFEMSIKDAYEAFNGLGKGRKKGWDRNFPTYVRSFKSNVIKLHEAHDIVYSGIKNVYKLKLKNRKTLTATKCHKIMTADGWVPLGKLKKGDYVMCDSVATKKTGNPKRVDSMVRCLKYYPFGSKDRGETKRVEQYRLIYDASVNNLELQEMINILKTDEKTSKTLIFSDPKTTEIHHIDGIPTNNDPLNLVAVSKLDHKKFHRKEQSSAFRQGEPEYVEVTSVEFVGKACTYDIQCLAPFHNFVAQRYGYPQFG